MRHCSYLVLPCAQGQPNRPMRSVNGEVMKGVGTPPVVVYKGGGPPESGPHGNHLYRGDSYDGRGGMMDSPARSRDFIQQGPQTRDSRTLTWDRNPKPDRSDPKYFPVNSLPRKNGGLAAGPQQPGSGSAANVDASPMSREGSLQGMPPPMRELNTGYQSRNNPGSVGAGIYGQGQQPPPQGYYSPAGMGGLDYPASSGGAGPGGQISGAGSGGPYSQSGDTGGASGEHPPPPGRGQRLLHRMAEERNRSRLGLIYTGGFFYFDLKRAASETHGNQ